MISFPLNLGQNLMIDLIHINYYIIYNLLLDLD